MEALTSVPSKSKLVYPNNNFFSIIDELDNENVMKSLGGDSLGDIGIISSQLNGIGAPNGIDHFLE